MDFGAMLRRLFRKPAVEALATRLSEAEAVALAKQAAKDHWLRDKLNSATPWRNERGAVVWTVDTGGVGSHLSVVLEDESGAILDVQGFDGR